MHRLGAGTAGPNWPKGHSRPYGTLLSVSQSHLGGKRPLISSSATANSALPRPPLDRVPVCHIYTSLKSPRGSKSITAGGAWAASSSAGQAFWAGNFPIRNIKLGDETSTGEI